MMQMISEGKKRRFALEYYAKSILSIANRRFLPSINNNNYVIPNEADEGGLMRNLLPTSKIFPKKLPKI
jgi:hypothetical protein